jgi:hypothetical protein
MDVFTSNQLGWVERFASMIAEREGERAHSARGAAPAQDVLEELHVRS